MRTRALEELARLFDLMATLRGENGCPWDRAQTSESLLPYLLEETYELVDAVRQNDPKAMAEELGDLLVEVAMQVAVAESLGGFDLEQVAAAASSKMIARHPHVFAGAEVKDAAQLLGNWERAKRLEKPERSSALDGIPESLPALLQALAVRRRAERGVPGAAGLGPADRPMTELAGTLEDLPQAGPEADFVVGELLWQVVGECRRIGVDPEAALRRVISQRSRAYRAVEATPTEGS